MLPPTPNGLTRSQRAALAIVNRLPAIVVRETERVVLYAALSIVGITSLMAVQTPGTIAAVLPIWILVEWSVTLILGGGLTLVGMVRSHRTLERGGIILTGLGCLVYAGALFSVGGPRAWVIGGLFVAITLGCVIRLLASTAAAALLAQTKRGE